jgi:hypothetical protein
MDGEAMSPQDFLQPDRRWALWKCQTHEQFIVKYFLPGKFHPAVPEKITEAYKTVERLIAYSYFYYPMTEEVGSKLTRIFEMAVRLRLEELSIKTEKMTKAGKLIPENLSVLIENLRNHPFSDKEWGKEWVDFKELRNLHAHPTGPNYGGDISLLAVAPMLNIINSIFITADWFSATRERLKVLQDKVDFYSKGVFVLNRSGIRLLITRAIPIVISHDEKRSIWIMEPIGLKYPQTMEEYSDFNPMVLRLTDLYIGEDSLNATDYLNNQKIIITPSAHPSDLEITKEYFKQMNTSAEELQRVFNQNSSYHIYYGQERFIYDEFWT